MPAARRPPGRGGRAAGGSPWSQRARGLLARPTDDVVDQALIAVLQAAEPGHLVRRCVDAAATPEQLRHAFATYRALQHNVPMPAAADAESWTALRRQLQLAELVPHRAQVDQVIWEACEDLAHAGQFGRARPWDPHNLAERLHVQSLARLQVLDLGARQIRHEDLHDLLRPLAGTRELRALSLAYNDLDDDAMRRLTARFIFWPKLESLRIAGNAWGAAAATALQDALDTPMPLAGQLEAAVWTGAYRDTLLPEHPVCPRLCDLGPLWSLTPPFVAVAERLPERRRALTAAAAATDQPADGPTADAADGTRDVAELWAAARGAARVEGGVALQAELRGCRDGRALTGALLRATGVLPRIESLELGGRPLARGEQAAIAGLLGGFARSLRVLGLAAAGLDDAGVAALGDSLPRLPELRACDLRHNAFGLAGVGRLCAGIARAPALTTVLVDAPLWPPVRRALTGALDGVDAASVAAGCAPAARAHVRFAAKDGASTTWRDDLADAERLDEATLRLVAGVRAGAQELQRSIVRGVALHLEAVAVGAVLQPRPRRPPRRVGRL